MLFYKRDVFLNVSVIIVSCVVIGAFGASVFNPYRYQRPDGRYFIYQNPDGQFRAENWTIDGIARGSFGWQDHNGIETALEFIADERGYRVIRRRNFTLTEIKSKPPAGIEEDPSDPEHSIISYQFGYASGSSFRVEQKRKSGIVYGKYGFLDANGRLIVVNYVSRQGTGFLVIRETHDPAKGSRVRFTEAYQSPLRDVATELGLRDKYRGKAKPPPIPENVL